jgi:hypothetical protein
MNRLSLPISALVLLATTLSAETPSAPRLAGINDAAAFLAGEALPNESEHPLALTDAWRTHSAQFGKTFDGHLERVLAPMSEWSGTEVGPVTGPGATVRYLFSGPDILHAFHMFPTADSFVLCGLEPVGRAPEMDSLNEGNAARALAEVRKALDLIVQISFFRTKDMKEDLQSAMFPGTTPLMLVFLAKSGQYIDEIEFFQLQKDGTLAGQGLEATNANGVRIVFSPRRLDQPKTLHYFSCDLSNGGFDPTGFGAWIAGQPKGAAYLKAASFLMHNDWFSKVRDHLLESSYLVVQDDSGIPFRRFDPELWSATLYGVYTGPIDLFKDSYQRDLASAYQTESQPLPFGTGYKWRKGESNLMRFVRQDHEAPVPAPTTSETEATQKAGAESTEPPGPAPDAAANGEN